MVQRRPDVGCKTAPYSWLHEMASSGMRVAAGVCIRRVEEAVLKDLGGRGVAALACPGDMEPAARALHSSTCVGVSTGFPCLPDPPHHETDGPPGAMALAHALTVLGKEVLMLTDRTTTPVMAGLLRPRPDAVVSPAATVVPFPFVPSSSEAEAETQRRMLSRIDHMVAIERSGRAADGCHYSMTGRDISALVEPIDDVFLASCAPTGCGTTAIGDGGNEVGMGKVRNQVEEHIPKGKLIACTTPADFLIAAGVSNWGAYGLVAALALVHFEATGDRATALQMLHTLSREEQLVDTLNQMGVVCGISRKPNTVDGLAVDAEHADMIAHLYTIVCEGTAIPA